MKNKAAKKSLVLGITGSFGSGKTTVSRIWKRYGAAVIDADRIYFQLINPPSQLYKKIVACFGRGILGNNQQIERKKLAQLVFSRPLSLKKLCRITHPVIIKKIKQELHKLKRIKEAKILIIDAPLLIEAGLANIVDKLIVVKINRKNQLKRLKRQHRMSQVEIIKRIRAQMPLREKIKLADYVIDNNGTLKETARHVEDIWKKLQ